MRILVANQRAEGSSQDLNIDYGDRGSMCSSIADHEAKSYATGRCFVVLIEETRLRGAFSRNAFG